MASTGKENILGATESSHDESGTTDDLLTDTDGTEHSEDAIPVSETTITTTSPMLTGNYELVSAQADQESEQPQAESQDLKKALNPNLTGSPDIAPATMQDTQTPADAPAPSLLDTVLPIIQNATVADAPVPAPGS